MKQLEVTILGQSYLLGCPEGGESSLLAAVASVDREMSGIRDAGKVKARERIAVLAALNLAYQLAERPVAAPVATSTASTASEGAPTAAAVPGSADLETLIRRVDAVLHDDGLLL